MKSIKLIIPRGLIKEHDGHPEDYGESIITLINDMYTDIYTNSEGQIYSPTNDEELIEYVNQNQVGDPKLVFEEKPFKIRTLEFFDVGFLEENKKKNEKLKENEIFLFISHSITAQAHMFMIEKDNDKIGIIGYELYKDNLLFNYEIYKEDKISEEELDKVFKIIKDYASNNYKFKRIILSISRKDKYLKLFLKRNNFKKIRSRSIKYPYFEVIKKKKNVFELF